MADREQPREVEIPERIMQRVDRRVSRARFSSSSEYITFVLEEVLAQLDEIETDRTSEEIDDDEIEQRLTALGYLDE
jgi:Arc/MetJ-type ribon-helix-helix transcriptional regulator